MSGRMVFSLLLVVLVAPGCARYVMRNSEVGVVAIPVDTNVWPLRYRDKARQLMHEHFPEGYVIEHQEEVVVGQTTHVDQHYAEHGIDSHTHHEGHSQAGATYVTATTNDDTEWRIYYRRRGGKPTSPRHDSPRLEGPR